MNEYSELSINLTKSISKKIKKENGIYFTPNSIVKDFSNLVFSYFPNKTSLSILEPSCGSLAFISHIDSLFPTGFKIIGVEKNPEIVETYNDILFNNDLELFQMDFLEFPGNFSVPDKFNIIIGNPPYFVMKANEVPEKYTEIMVGRPNIFGLFIVKCLEMLEENGVLGFILPNSFLNSNYYSKIRELIITNYKLELIKEYNSDFLETEQGTIGMIVSKRPKETLDEGNLYYKKVNGTVIFTPNRLKLDELLEGSKTLKELGCKVKTGTIVWNQVKELLTDDQNKTLLIYNSNLNNGQLELKDFKNDEKKQYIDKNGVNEPILVVNRGNGNASYKLDWLYIDGSYSYLVENHLNMIQIPNKTDEERKVIIEKIIDSFKNPKTKEFIDIFLGNNGLSKTELEEIFPIYL